jgi:hypothetical protein
MHPQMGSRQFVGDLVWEREIAPPSCSNGILKPHARPVLAPGADIGASSNWMTIPVRTFLSMSEIASAKCRSRSAIALT